MSSGLVRVFVKAKPQKRRNENRPNENREERQESLRRDVEKNLHQNKLICKKNGKEKESKKETKRPRCFCSVCKLRQKNIVRKNGRLVKEDVKQAMKEHNGFTQC